MPSDAAFKEAKGLVEPALRLGLELPSPSADQEGPAGLSVAEWRAAGLAAEESGVGCLWLDGGAHEEPPTPDGATLAGAMAAVTSRVSVGVVGTLGPRSAHPSVLARAVTSLDHVSGGRAAVLIELGPELAPSPDRWELLVESAEVCHSLFSREVSTVPGRHYALLEAANRPPPVRPGGPLLVVQLPDTNDLDDDRAISALRALAGSVRAFAVGGGRDEVERTRRAIDRAGLPVGQGGPGLVWRGHDDGGGPTDFEGMIDGRILRAVPTGS